MRNSHDMQAESNITSAAREAGQTEMNTIDLEKAINELIASKSEATPQMIALALAVHPQVIKDIETLEFLKRVTRFSDICVLGERGSVCYSDFRADWSCGSTGYGYSDVVQDFRKGFLPICGSSVHDNSLTVTVKGGN